ncbi:Protein of unknown function [Gryllus bimaculatus]|nr:Protein of unknown function [Gryllus bimaculatus]
MAAKERAPSCCKNTGLLCVSVCELCNGVSCTNASVTTHIDEENAEIKIRTASTENADDRNMKLKADPSKGVPSMDMQFCKENSFYFFCDF